MFELIYYKRDARNRIEVLPLPGEKSDSSLEDDVESWLSKIKALYGKERAEDYREEEPVLREFLLRLKDETQGNKRLSMCKLEYPFRRGGSSIVFKARHTYIPDHEIALKFNRPREDATNRVRNEIAVLKQLDYSNIIRVIDAGEFDVVFNNRSYPLLFIEEPFISGVMSLREYAESLSYKRAQEVNERSLDSSLLRLISILRQWIEALAYIHEKGFVYVDIKPDNAVVDKDGHVLVIDFGSVVEVDETDDSPIEIVVTDGYPDPDITTQIVRSITPEKLRASVKRSILIPLKDHFALGQSVMELLDIVSKEHPHDFPQRPLFQSVYLLATRLLNGKNEEKVRTGSRHRLKEVYRGLLRTDYETIYYRQLKDALRDLQKEDGSWTLKTRVPELETYPKESIKFVPNINTALTERLKTLLEHPLIARLKLVSQLGLISLVYPTADHSRYDHIMGSYTYTAAYIRSLFDDPYNCLFRNLVDEKDVKAALLASMIHDLGQYPLAHDLQEVSGKIFDHTSLSIDLLSDKTKDKKKRTLKDIIQDPEEGWDVDPERLKRILGAHSGQLTLKGIDVSDFKADMLSALIDGPIDADKADYITRDSINCRIPYGKQLDIERLLMVLTTVRIPEALQTTHKVTIGVYEKGRASASAFSLARYLLYASVYWHHTSRIIKAMLQYGTVLVLPREVFYDSEKEIREIHEKLVYFVKGLTPPFEERQEARPRGRPEKQIVEAEPPSSVLKTVIEAETSAGRGEEPVWYPGISVTDRLMLKWLRTLPMSDKGDRGVALIDMILQRQLYKRAYTIERIDSNNELLDALDELGWLQKITFCEQLQKNIRQMIKYKKRELETRPLTSIDEVDRLFSNYLVILVDIPNPRKYAESGRPLIYLPELERKTYYHDGIMPIKEENLSDALECLMKTISPVRILCHPDILQWIRASINLKEMKEIVANTLKGMPK
jgi:serine/threonine protein kinase